MKKSKLLKLAILGATGAQDYKPFPSGGGCDLVMADGSKCSCLIDERKAQDFDGGAYTYTDEYLLTLRAVNKGKKRGFLIVVDKTDVSRVCLIDVYAPHATSCHYTTSFIEGSEMELHHFTKFE